MSTLAYMVTA